MISVSKGKKVLLWASSYEFGSHVSKLLSESKIPWAIFSTLAELNRENPSRWAALLMDGDSAEIDVALRKLRSRPSCGKLPIVLIGGDPFPILDEDPYLLQIPLPENVNDFGFQITDEVVTDIKPPKVKISDASSQRTSYRHVCNVATNIQVEATIIDISEGGAQVECPFDLPPGTILRLSLSVLNPDMRTTVRFKVLRSRSCLPPKKAYRLHGIFDGVSKELLTQLRKTMLQVQTHRDKRLETLMGMG